MYEVRKTQVVMQSSEFAAQRAQENKKRISKGKNNFIIRYSLFDILFLSSLESSNQPAVFEAGRILSPN
jgi:hypothetical protein